MSLPCRERTVLLSMFAAVRSPNIIACSAASVTNVLASAAKPRSALKVVVLEQGTPLAEVWTILLGVCGCAFSHG